MFKCSCRPRLGGSRVPWALFAPGGGSSCEPGMPSGAVQENYEANGACSFHHLRCVCACSASRRAVGQGGAGLEDYRDLASGRQSAAAARVADSRPRLQRTGTRGRRLRALRPLAALSEAGGGRTGAAGERRNLLGFLFDRSHDAGLPELDQGASGDPQLQHHSAMDVQNRRASEISCRPGRSNLELHARHRAARRFRQRTWRLLRAPGELVRERRGAQGFPPDPDEATWNYTQGTELRDASGKELGDYYARLVSWYGNGGFTDELGQRHESGHHFKIAYWEVLNEPDFAHATTPEQYTARYDAIVAAIREVAPEIKFVGISVARSEE